MTRFAQRELIALYQKNAHHRTLSVIGNSTLLSII